MLLGKCLVQGSVQVSQTRMNTHMHVERSLLEMRLFVDNWIILVLPNLEMLRVLNNPL